MNIDIIGIFQKFIFKNEDTNYGVGVLYNIKDSQEYIINGDISYIEEGNFIEVKCVKQNHKTYGTQYKVIECLPAEPFTEEGIKAYIASKFKGIGPITSSSIIGYFKENTLKVLDEETNRIHEIKSISKNKRDIIVNGWKQERERDGIIRSLIISLQEMKYGLKRINKIVDKIKVIDLKYFLENPYVLLDISDINFKVIDSFALRIGFPVDSSIRLLRGIEYFSQYLLKDGHCYIEEEEFILNLTNHLIQDTELLKEKIIKAEELGYIEIVQKNIKENLIIPKIYAECEKNIVNKISTLLEGEGILSNIDFNEFFNNSNEQSDLKLNENQIDAVKNALNTQFSIITGGPGTGKTTIVKTILDLSKKLSSKEISIQMLAPTGKAAKRMTQTTNHPASTIHRAIFSLGEGGSLKADLIILDEASMIDLETMSWFLNHVNENTSLVLLGDVDQLRSVGPGQILKDLIDSNVIPRMYLTKVYRFNEGYIKRNAYNINNGKDIELPESGEKDSDFYFMEYSPSGYNSQNYANNIINCIVKLYKDHIPKKKNVNPIENIQIIAPMRNGLLGVDNLNKVIQDKINPIKKKAEVIYYNNNENSFRIKDKVMQTVNNYNKGVFNGEIGIIENIDIKKKQVVVNYEIGKVLYEYNELFEIELAYVSTIHKSQGSEFDYLIIPMYMGYYNMLERQILYTGVTRAKLMVIIIGDKKAVDMSIKNDNKKERKTWLKNRLIYAMK